jgi:hypothetical protein
VGRRARYARDHDPPTGEIDADVRRRAVVFIVAERELSPAPVDRVPRAGVQHRLEFIEARSRGRADDRRDTREARFGRAATSPIGPGRASATRVTARPGMVMKNSTATHG